MGYAGIIRQYVLDMKNDFILAQCASDIIFRVHDIIIIYEPEIVYMMS